MRTTETRIAGRTVLTFTPQEHIVVGRQRLEMLRAEPEGSAIDSSIFNAVKAARRPPVALILRGGSDDGNGSWRFDQKLTDTECAELGYLLLRSQLALYRELVKMGILMFAKVDWGPDEVAGLDEGRHRVLADLAADVAKTATDDAKARLALDEWIIRHFTYWLLTSFDESQHIFERTLPRVGSLRVRVDRLLVAAGFSAVGE